MRGARINGYWIDEASDTDAPAEPMRSRHADGPRRKPSTDTKRIRRQMRRGGAVAQEESTMATAIPTRVELLKALASAKTFQERTQLVEQLETLDRQAQLRKQMDAEIDFARTQVTAAMSPVISQTALATTESDWLVEDLPGAETLDHSAIVAKGALWFQQVPEFVREDGEEFAEQARGAARLASSLADGQQIFTDYVGFLRERTAASGVPQIQQVVAPDGVTVQPTPLPPEVFDNFAPPVNDLNAGVVGTETSDRAPAIQMAVSGGDGGSPEVPGGHSESGTMTGPGAEPSMGSGGSSAPEEPGGHQDSGAPGGQDPTKRQAASGLPMIQQTKDADDNPSSTPLPADVAFPWTMGGPEDGLEGEAHYDQGGEPPASHQSTAVHHRADQWTQPSQLVEPNIANTPATDPPRTPAAAGSGAADKAAAESFPSFGDAHAAAGYTQSYDSASDPSGPRDVPVSMGGDNGQSQQHPRYASQRIASRQEMLDPDFQRGYKYAAKWRPGTPLVRTGSAELEAGIYAALTDRPHQRSAWINAHAALAERAPELGKRIAQHRELTHKVAAANGWPTDGTYLQVTAATGTDLDTYAPGTSPSPTGDTPINGPGRPGPLAGGMDAAAPGGPAPYNGAEPMGSPVVPPMQSVPTQGKPVTVPDTSMSAAPGTPLTPSLSAFRRTVQANRLNQSK